MRGLNNPFPAPDTDNVHRRFNLGPASLLLLEKRIKTDPVLFSIRLGQVFLNYLI